LELELYLISSNWLDSDPIGTGRYYFGGSKGVEPLLGFIIIGP